MNQPPPAPVEIPMDLLSPEALQGVIENFIQREGTDYGWEETALQTKVNQVQRQLESGQIKIAFDAETETVSLLTLNDWKRRIQACSK